MTNVRKDIPAKYKWDLTAIYADQAAFDADFAKVGALIDSFKAHQNTMCDSAEGLYKALDDAETIGRLAEKLYEYASLNSDVDTSDNRFLALKGKVMNLFNEYASAAFFVEPYLIRIPEEKIGKWFKEYPKLADYRRTIETIRRYKPHTLSDECEKLLADMQNGLGSHSSIRSVFANADLTFGKIKDENGKPLQLTDTTYVPLLMGTDRRVRRAAFTKLYETYSQYGNTFASLLDGFVKEKTTMAKVRLFENSQEASVFGDEVTPAICHNLVNTVNANLSPLFRYYELKRKALGVQKLHLY